MAQSTRLKPQSAGRVPSVVASAFRRKIFRLTTFAKATAVRRSATWTRALFRRRPLRLAPWPLGVVLCALGLAVASGASATTILPADFADVVNGSQLIVYGRVVDVRSEMTAGRRSIHSFVTVAVEQALKGNPGTTVMFRVPQGQVGRYRRIIVGAPEFSVGEDVMLFLTGRAPAIPTVFGLNQGVRRLRGDTVSRQRVLDSYTREVRAIVERAR